MKKLLFATSNFVAVLVLVGFLAAPFYFANSVAKPSKVFGVKTEKTFILTSQIENFPNLQYVQTGEEHKVSFAKLSSSQAFIGVFILTNSVSSGVNYKITKTQGSSEVFFGEDLKDKNDKVFLPSGASVPISIHSTNLSKLDPETVVFEISSD